MSLIAYKRMLEDFSYRQLAFNNFIDLPRKAHTKRTANKVFLMACTMHIALMVLLHWTLNRFPVRMAWLTELEWNGEPDNHYTDVFYMQ